MKTLATATGGDQMHAVDVGLEALASNSYQFKSIQAHSISSVRSSEPNV
jgi:hypothetical protein